MGKWFFTRCSELLNILTTGKAIQALTVCELSSAWLHPLFFSVSTCRVLLAHLVLRGDKERREPR